MSVARVPWVPLLLLWGVVVGGAAWTYAPALLETPWAVVQDDARHFVVWLRNLEDPDLFANDPMARFFRGVTSDLYEALYLPAVFLGIDIVRWHMLLLMPAITLLALLSMERFLAVFEPDEITRLSMLIVMAAAFHGLYTLGLPRDLALPIVCLAVFAYATRRPLLIGGVMFAGAAIYPAAAITAGVGLGLCEAVRRVKARALTSRTKTILVAAGCGALGILSFMAGGADFGPTFSLAEARDLPIFQSGGRTAYFTGGGDWERMSCGERAGLFAYCRHGRFWWLSYPVHIALIAAALVLLARRGTAGWDILAALCLGGIALFMVATLVAFELHLPSRYARWSLHFVTVFSAAVLLALGLVRTLGAVRLPKVLAPLAVGALAIAAYSRELTTVPGLVIDSYPRISATLRETPPDTLVAGLPYYIDSIPSFAARSVLASLELSVPYKTGYHAEMARRTAMLRALFEETDPSRWIETHVASGVDIYLLVESEAAPDVWSARIASWSASFQDAPSGDAASIFAAYPEAVTACVMGHQAEMRLLDGHCFAERLPTQ